MRLVMSGAERVLFEAFLRKTKVYVEFGAGGSTCMAAHYASQIISVDSGEEWIGQVRAELNSRMTNTAHVTFVRIDIGSTKKWGHPIDESHKNRWPLYSQEVWNTPDANAADLYLIDGRFRVACFAETVARAPIGAFIMIHDFESRVHYHAIKGLTKYIANSESLGVFQKDNSANINAAKLLASSFRYDHA